MKYSGRLILSTLLTISFLQTNARDWIASYSPGTEMAYPVSEPLSAPAAKLDYEILETNVRGFITSVKDRFPVQLGAFRLKLNAEAFFIEVRNHIDNNAIMILEEGLYKIRIAMPGGSEKSSSQPVPDTIRNNNTIKSYPEVSDSAKTAEIASDPATVKEQNTNEAGNLLIIGGDSPWLRRVKYFGRSIVFINALIVTITVSIATMLILLVIILLNRNRMEREERLKDFLLEKYQGLIIDYLFGSAKPDDFRPIASDNYRRQVLIDQMIDVSINLKGEEAKKLLGLYKHLGLDRDSINRAYDFRWHKKIKGFRELAFMNIKDANDAIYKVLNSSNEILRMEAQIALVRLSDENPFEFLSHLARPFSLYEQITLHELMVQHEIKPPSFIKWLSSSNDTVVMFALRMIREFKQKDGETGVNDMLTHGSPSVRWLAVQVAGDMGLLSTLETMKRMYKNQEYNICLEIVKSMGKMPDISMLGFLKLVLDKEDDVQLQIEATKAIENMGEEGVKTLVKLMKSEYKNYNIIVRHVLDRRIY
jgi:hypothetical protein